MIQSKTKRPQVFTCINNRLRLRLKGIQLLITIVDFAIKSQYAIQKWIYRKNSQIFVSMAQSANTINMLFFTQIKVVLVKLIMRFLLEFLPSLPSLPQFSCQMH